MGKDKDKDKKSTKSSKSKDKSEKDKKSKGSKSEKEKKSSKSGRSEKSATPSKDKSKSKVDDDKSTKSRKTSKSKSRKDNSPAPSQLDVESQLKSQLDADIMNKGGATLTDMANLNKMGAELPGGFNTTGGMQSESPFRVQPILNPHVIQKQSCLLHNKPLRYFCDSCEELLCYDCTVMGPHNTQLHRICNIEEAFRYRFDQVNKQIHQSLVPKRAQLIGQIVRLDHRLDEIKTVKQVIERDIRNEYAGVMERLKSAEGVKTAVLQHDIAEVQKDITRIDEILMFMEDIATGGNSSGQGVDVGKSALGGTTDLESAMKQGADAASQAAATQQNQGPNTLGLLHSFR